MLLMILYNIGPGFATVWPGKISTGFYKPGKVKLPAERLAPAVGGNAPEPFHEAEAEPIEPCC